VYEFAIIIKNGFSKEVSSKTYDMIYNFITSFGFNKSHSVGYAYVSYQMAYLKAHYSKYFMKYLLSMVIGN
jgi:DNA polymerase-3 subunit alpha